MNKTIKEVFHVLNVMIKFDRFRGNLTICTTFPEDCLLEISFIFKTIKDVHPVKGTPIYATNDYTDFMALNSQIIQAISTIKDKYSIEIQKTGPSSFDRWMSSDTISIKIYNNDYQRIMQSSLPWLKRQGVLGQRWRITRHGNVFTGRRTN